MKVILVFLLLILPVSISATKATFTNKVWARVDSTGLANDDRYTFLTDGTLVITSPYGEATLARWSWKGTKLGIDENGRPFEATIKSLTANELRLEVARYDVRLDMHLELVDPSEPDSIVPWRGFNPDAFRIMAAGSEPSWHFVVEGGRATMSVANIDGHEVECKNGSWTAEPRYRTWIFTATGPEGRVKFTLVENPGRCPDEGEERDYSLDARLERAGYVFETCALISRFTR